MNSRADIRHFYEKYKANLKKEEQVMDDLVQVSSQEEWLEKLKQKYRTMRQLYIENEALLNLYIRPYLDSRMELKQDVALEFVRQIKKAWQEGIEDNVSMLEMGETLEPYLYEHGLWDAYIWDCSILGILYNNCMEKKEGEKGYGYFKKVCAVADRYFDIADFEVRKRIIYAFYNRPILQVNFILEEEETLQWNLEQAMQFYQDPRVRAFDGERFDFDGLIEELNYDVYGNYVISHTRKNAARWFLERGEEVLGAYYEKELLKNPDPCAMPDEIFCYYKRTCFFLGHISCTQFLKEYSDYCRYSLEHDTLEHPGGFWESRLFHVAVNHLPGLLECLHLYGAECEGEVFDRHRCLQAYLDIIRQVPHGDTSRFVNDAIQRSLHSLMELVEEDDEEFDDLLGVMLSRNELTLIHSRMVGQIARLLLQEILEKDPGLLVGTLGCQNIVEVVENREQFISFIAHASRLFDIGKLKDTDIVNKQSRQLTQSELERIKEHPIVGAGMVKRSPSLSQFHDVILGHHKSWDGLMGYPADFDNTASRQRILIELIHISDCINAATDFIGRSYKVHKSLEEVLEELKLGSGTLYCPEIVDLLLASEKLQDRLKSLLNQGRIQTYYEVYNVGVEDVKAFSEEKLTGEDAPEEDLYARLDSEIEAEQDETERLIGILHESSQINYSFVRAMVRHSLLTLYVDLRSGRYQVFSRGEQRLFGSIANGTYDDFLEQYLRTIAMPKDWEKLCYQLNLSEVIHKLVMQEGNFACEMRVWFQESYHWVNLQFMQLDEKNVIPRSMAVVITDVQESHRQSDQMETVLKDAYHTAMEANKAKSTFLRSMSHDIRTPMNGIMGMVKLAQQNMNDPAKLAECLQKIEMSSGYLMRLLNEVLDMSRIESGKVVLRKEPVCLDALLQDVLEECGPDIRKARQELVVQLDVLKNVCVLADPVRLRQIFANLLSNAVMYTPDGGRVCLRARCLSEDPQKGNCYQFVIRDNGIGMSENFQKKMFEPFAREDNSMTNVKQGSGLGLSIVRTMIAEMNGTIEVESVQGRGTVFTVTLQFMPTIQTAPAEKEPEEEIRFDGHRILLVEDNELNREIACELLGESGLVIETATDGVEAVEQFRNSDPGYYDLILMDIQMPRLNGYGAAKEIRALPEEYARDIPIIAFTANAFQEDAMQAMESGMNAHIAKPINMPEVSKVLQKWLNNPEQKGEITE